MPICHFVNLTFCQLDILSTYILSTYHFVNLPFCQLTNQSTFNLVNLPFNQHTIQSIYDLVNLSFSQADERRSLQIDKTKNGQKVDDMVCRLNVKLTKVRGVIERAPYYPFLCGFFGLGSIPFFCFTCKSAHDSDEQLLCKIRLSGTKFLFASLFKLAQNKLVCFVPGHCDVYLNQKLLLFIVLKLKLNKLECLSLSIAS